jgi:hypothetical protein
MGRGCTPRTAQCTFEKATDLKAVMALEPKECFVPSMKGLMASQFSKAAANP